MNIFEIGDIPPALDALQGVELPELPAALQNTDFPCIPDATISSGQLDIPAFCNDTANSLVGLDTFNIEKITESVGTLYRAFTNITEIIFSLNEVFQDYWESHATILFDSFSKLAESFTNFKIPTITDEEAKALVESCKIWGRYGWTYMPSMPLTMFDSPPADITDANTIALQYCTSSDMDKVFEDLRKWEINNADLESAIFCYNSCNIRCLNFDCMGKEG